MSADKFIAEARARIIWGEAASSVREFMISNGISTLVADARLREFEVERRQELRKIGLRNVLVGIVLAGAAGITFYIALPLGSGFTSGWTRALALVLLAGVYGLWKLVKGVVYLVRPQSEHRSIPDIEQSSLIE
jgi:hypothetical protein